MSSVEQIIEKLNSGSASERAELLKPAVKAAVEVGLIPKHAPIEEYEKNWENIEKILRAFLNNF